MKKYSVLQYVYNKTGRTGTPSTNQKLIDLLETMLEYGAKAQIYLNYKTNRLVTANYYQVSVVGGTLPDCSNSGLYAVGEVVTITAPSTDNEGNPFSYWENDSGEVVGTTESLDVTVVSLNRTYTAVYGDDTPVIPDPEYSTGLAYSDNGDGTCTITGIGTCTDLDVLIPPTIDGLTVTEIGEKAFENQTALTDIVIPDTVTNIGRRAFYGCTGLTEFTIPSTVYDIGTQIFYKADNIHTVYYNTDYYPSTETENPLLNNSNITKVVFGGRFIDYYAARNLGMNGHVTEVKIGDSVNGIYSSAFYGFNSLVSAEISDGVTSIGNYVFECCTSLVSIKLPTTVTSIGERAFSGCTSLASIEIPNSVTSIAGWSFVSCTNLASIEIHEGLTYIGPYVFQGCTSLASVYYLGTISDWCDISFNGEYANPCCNGAALFVKSELLTEIDASDNVKRIGNYAFFHCTSLASVTISDIVTHIGDYAFNGCTGLTSIEIADSVRSIGVAAFSNCTSLTSIEIPDSVTSIAQSAFYGCSGLMSIEIPDSVTSIGESSFERCYNLTNVTIPDSVTNLGSYAFSYCNSIVNLEIPNSMTSIAVHTFSACSSLISVTIPDSVISIGSYAFAGCTGLTDVYYLGTSDNWGAIDIGGWNTNLLNATIHYYIPPFTVTFVDYDGVTVLKEETVEGFSTATPPVNPYREGYIFTGWSPDFVGATADMTTVAQYSVNTEPTLTVRSIETSANRTVEVKIMLENNPGILGMQFSMNYDSTALTLVNAVNGDAMSGLLYTAPSRFRSGCTFLWEGISLSGNEATSGEILILMFEVSEATPAGDYAIALTNCDGNVYDNDMNLVAVNVINGIIRVAD